VTLADATNKVCSKRSSSALATTPDVAAEVKGVAPASFAGDRQALIDDESSTRTSADPPTIQFQWTVAGGVVAKQRGFKLGNLGTLGINVGGQLP